MATYCPNCNAKIGVIFNRERRCHICDKKICSKCGSMGVDVWVCQRCYDSSKGEGKVGNLFFCKCGRFGSIGALGVKACDSCHIELCNRCITLVGCIGKHFLCSICRDNGRVLSITVNLPCVRTLTVRLYENVYRDYDGYTIVGLKIRLCSLDSSEDITKIINAHLSSIFSRRLTNIGTKIGDEDVNCFSWEHFATDIYKVYVSCGDEKLKRVKEAFTTIPLIRGILMVMEGYKEVNESKVVEGIKTIRRYGGEGTSYVLKPEDLRDLDEYTTNILENIREVVGSKGLPKVERVVDQRGAHFESKVEIKDSVVQRSTISAETIGVLKICPYCGKELNFPKPPKFCPYCKERLVGD